MMYLLLIAYIVTITHLIRGGLKEKYFYWMAFNLLSKLTTAIQCGKVSF